MACSVNHSVQCNRHFFPGKMFSVVICVLLLKIAPLSASGQSYSPHGYTEVMNNKKLDAEQFLRDYGREAAEMCNRVAMTEWKYAVNSTDFNKRRMKEQQSVSAKFECISWNRAVRFNYQLLGDQNLQRQFQRIVRQGRCGLADEKYNELHQIISTMKDNYNNVRICPFSEAAAAVDQQHLDYLSPISTNLYYNDNSPAFCDLRLDPDILGISEKSRDEAKLKYTWLAWHEKTGPPIRNTFMRYINLANQAAYVHGFRDAGEQMRAAYEDPDFYFSTHELWLKILPLYKQLFTFVRRGLHAKYGDSVLRRDGPIPAHILGNLWGQNWRQILDIVKTDPDETPDVTSELLRRGYTPTRIFQTAEEFFISMGFPPMSPEFWRNSQLQKQDTGRDQCTASAWNFCNNVDFRIKQCTQVTLEDFVNSHHEMTHIHYYMQYANQPFIYRQGPNPSLHEALGHAIALSVGGPVHLQQIDLLPAHVSTSTGNSKINIEYLLGVALDKLPFMSFSLAVDKWRWQIFEKGPVNMNARWWELRLRYQGIIPPVPRLHDNFDAAGKYHVISDQDYIKYFVATVLQFQVYAELCNAANHIGPLHTCDLYKSREAGRLLMKIMQPGASMSASDVIKTLTRGRASTLSVDALLQFFAPLSEWLEEQNRFEPYVGWSSNVEDVALFQSYRSSSAGNWKQSSVVKVVVVALSVIWAFYK